MANLPDLQDIYAARKRIAGAVVRTPAIASALVGAGGVPFHLKLETLQPSGAFKLRGATNAILNLDISKAENGVACCSTGNHGRAVSYAAARRGIRAVVCLSELVPDVKVRAIEALGAEVRRVGQSQDEAEEEVQRLVASDGVTNIHPFDNFDVLCGQGTLGIELIEDIPELETILVPLSGGGLAGGIALAAKSLNPKIRVIGLSMDRGAAMAESLKAGRPVEVTEVPSLADSLGGGIGLRNRFSFAACQRYLDDVVLLSEQEIYDGMRALFLEDRLVAEGASAVAHAAILSGRLTLSGPTATIITGRNVDMRQFSAVAAGRPVTLGDLTVKGSSK
ncbi:hydroxyectoine utilization dehydratase EutB [Defluviimonas salinarum]|uniref:Hydroxyectoine utilization dehydratase EutB n=1 Tax=Defluviimonas salinarum TaxID=2992147 RepID=A0ABT3J7F2_9RHOB|nr:hydroxyectoine utilization dehydratase EutB [Defluviimonas salinarum]MCW3783618.1 hydroxyectoine utilization dehydratase EutB [Defluviimonas salinarum]